MQKEINILLNSLSIIPGSMVIRDTTEWRIVLPGEDRQVLTIDPDIHLPQWSDPAAGGGTITAVLAGEGIDVAMGGDPATEATVALSEIPDTKLLANLTGEPGPPLPVALSDVIDYIVGDTRAALLFRGASGWQALAHGTIGFPLASGDATHDPTWVSNLITINGVNVALGGSLDLTGDEIAGIFSGFAPSAYSLGHSHNATYASTITLPINGGSVAMPVQITAPMALTSISVAQKSTANLRTAEWRLYADANTSATLNEVANANGTFSFTPSAADVRTSAAASSPILLRPGLYWLVIRNTSSAQTFQLGGTAQGTPFDGNRAETKTLATGLGSTLDLVTTWTKDTNMIAARLDGLVMGQATPF